MSQIPSRKARHPSVKTCMVPTQAHLDERARRTVRPGGGPLNAVEWVCFNRDGHSHGHPVTNHPTRNFLLDLPPLYCSQCSCLNPAGYEWSMVTSTVRGVPIDCLIRNQGDHNTCIAHSMMTAVDLGRKIKWAYECGYYVGQPLSILSFFRRYYEVFQDTFGMEQGSDKDRLIDLRDQCFLHIAQLYGIEYELPYYVGTPHLPGPSQNTLRMGNAFSVPCDNIQLIIRLLASGIPLVCGSVIGRAFGMVTSQEIYDVGEATTDVGYHSVVLLGHGITHYPGNPTEMNKYSCDSWPMNPSGVKGPRLYYRCRGSWGDEIHPKGSLDSMGGDFNLWADGITFGGRQLWGFDPLELAEFHG